jgi:hypothetical protein
LLPFVVMATHRAAHHPARPADLAGERASTPEQRLMRAVLDDALDVVLDPRPHLGRRDRALRGDAERWLAEDDREWPFSFVNVCEALAIDPVRLREFAAGARLRDVRAAA